MRRLSGSAKSDHMPVQIEALDGSNIHLEIWVRLRELNIISLLSILKPYCLTYSQLNSTAHREKAFVLYSCVRAVF